VAWLEKRVPASARIGVFNAGVPAYFSDLKIINLDGTHEQRGGRPLARASLR
jgi:hypothetical protein